jgi:hypothetical protein
MRALNLMAGQDDWSEGTRLTRTGRSIAAE